MKMKAPTSNSTIMHIPTAMEPPTLRGGLVLVIIVAIVAFAARAAV
jgi:hypothetical protein